MPRHLRPIRDRVWFWKPQRYWHGWSTLIPFFRGGDEFDWHTIGIGWTFTGRVIIATRPCPETGRCANDAIERREPMAKWPIDVFGYDHSATTAPTDTASAAGGGDRGE